jgi:hypothetical protein
MIGAVSALLRRIRGTSVEDERAMLRHAQESAALQLDAMKHELAERVQAVRDRERALEDALTSAPGQHVVALPRADDDAAQVAQRERAVAAREEMLARREQELAQAPPLLALPGSDAAERERLEQRLAELRDAEKLFLRTQAELASRSEEVAARERLVAGRERAGDTGHQDRTELTELEARLRRLERAGASTPSEDTASFAGGLESLRRRGTRRQP